MVEMMHFMGGEDLSTSGGGGATAIIRFHGLASVPRLEVLNVNMGQQHARRYRCSCPKKMTRARARARLW